MLFLVQLESLIDGYDEGFYPRSFTVNLCGVCNEAIENKYKYMHTSVLITDDEIKLGKNIAYERKKIIYRVYKKYGKINEHKLNEMLHSENSPVCVDTNPSVLAFIMMNRVTFRDDKLAKWYMKFLSQLEDEKE